MQSHLSTGRLILAPVDADRILLEDGTRLLVRPLRAADRDEFAALFERLSPESRLRRFLGPKPSLTPRELTYMTNVDHVRHEALAAIDEATGHIVAVSRYAAFPRAAGVAEVAFEVADDLQGRGIGVALAERVIWRARENGFQRLVATTRMAQAHWMARAGPSNAASVPSPSDLTMRPPWRSSCRSTRES